MTKTNNAYQAFSHGLILSKQWLCESLEKIISENNIIKPTVYILGCWHNVLGLMLLIRNPNFYNLIKSYDKDQEAIDVSNKICDAYTILDVKIENICKNVYEVDFSHVGNNTIFINCSVDQFDTTDWYQKIPTNSLVCIQSTDIIDGSQNWEITQTTKDLNEFKNKYTMSNILFEGTKKFTYPTLSYNRLMLIGYK